MGHATVQVNREQTSPAELGAAAVDFLIGLIQRNERGIPDNPQTILLEPKWVDGDTVKLRTKVSSISPMRTSEEVGRGGSIRYRGRKIPPRPEGAAEYSSIDR